MSTDICRECGKPEYKKKAIKSYRRFDNLEIKVLYRIDYLTRTIEESNKKVCERLKRIKIYNPIVFSTWLNSVFHIPNSRYIACVLDQFNLVKLNGFSSFGERVQCFPSLIPLVVFTNVSDLFDFEWNQFIEFTFPRLLSIKNYRVFISCFNIDVRIVLIRFIFYSMEENNRNMQSKATLSDFIST